MQNLINSIKSGGLFKLKKSVTYENLCAFGYTNSSARWILKQGGFEKLDDFYGPSPEFIYYLNFYDGRKKYFHISMIEKIETKTHNHPLTSIFSDNFNIKE